MGILQTALMGTLCSILLQLTPANMEPSEQQLVNESQPVIMVDYATGLSAMPYEALATAFELIQVRPFQHRVRVKYAEEDKGNIQECFVLHEPAPT
jgi:hypothetical protein